MSKTQDVPNHEPAIPENKRKRAKDVASEDELEIDINAPEPPSKKAKRKEEKAALKKKRKEPSELALAAPNLVKAYFDGDTAQHSKGPLAAQKRSEYGIWIGNLPFNATRETLRLFLSTEGGIEGRDIVRLHLPAPFEKDAGLAAQKAQNKGFAYIDFTTKETLDKAVALSEKLLSGRRVLIKDAKSYEGRPPKPAEGDAGAASKKEPSKRVFVGNLGFDVTHEGLAEHFAQAGEVDDIFMATFEDSGNCKGFAWVRFIELDAAVATVRGYVYRDANDADAGAATSDDDDGVEATSDAKERKHRQQKHFINRLHGRILRCEFAEDAQTRYKKRYGKDSGRDPGKDYKDAKAAREPHALVIQVKDGNADDSSAKPTESAEPAAELKPARSKGKEQRREDRRKRHDARSIAPGQALANTQRASGAIVAGVGKKISFD